MGDLSYPIANLCSFCGEILQKEDLEFIFQTLVPEKTLQQAIENFYSKKRNIECCGASRSRR